MDSHAQWLDQVREVPIEPHLRIVDPHHHLWKDNPHGAADFMPADYLRLCAGHNIVATVFADCMQRYRTDGPEHLRYAGETAWVEAVASAFQRDNPSGPALCRGITARADLTLGKGVGAVLDAHRDASPRRFRAIRHTTAWDPEPSLRYDFPMMTVPQEVMRDPRFGEGLAALAARGIVFDAWLYAPQLPELIKLAERHPAAVIVVNHVGGLLLAGPYARRRDEIVEPWRHAMRELARCPNVHVKLGGMQMRRTGLFFGDRPRPPDSDELARDLGGYMRHAIDCFSPRRCMFESNLPIERESCSATVLWNAFKKISSGYAPADRADLFEGTATRVYRLNDSGPGHPR